MLYEPRPLMTVHSDELANVMIIGDKMHFALSISQPSIVHAGSVDLLINHRHSMPVVGVMRALPIVIFKLAEVTAFSTSEMVRHLVSGARYH